MKVLNLSLHTPALVSLVSYAANTREFYVCPKVLSRNQKFSHLCFSFNTFTPQRTIPVPELITSSSALSLAQ
ncbi:hypothetical protein B9Z19DRAFT_1080596 [Tuber borchii]|uniref:Uncharacterized protein n=1 Tax=Tuber borchii TaxID=42251 RepID=A0A2T6ZWN2_TUBBO|nr:hypothetical protein B9Z19DRAFT_1080596 [Tuber borchii]